MTFTITIPWWLPIGLLWLTVVALLSAQALKDARDPWLETGTPCYWLIQIGIYMITMTVGIIIGGLIGN